MSAAELGLYYGYQPSGSTSNATITGALFINGDYREQPFVGSEIRFALFDEADLRKADFSGSTLEHVSFRGAKLTEASFEGATLKHCDFTGAVLVGASFLDAFAYGLCFENTIIARLISGKPAACPYHQLLRADNNYIASQSAGIPLLPDVDSYLQAGQLLAEQALGNAIKLRKLTEKDFGNIDSDDVLGE
jgi:hypothetical protein